MIVCNFLFQKLKFCFDVCVYYVSAYRFLHAEYSNFGAQKTGSDSWGLKLQLDVSSGTEPMSSVRLASTLIL